MTIAIAEYIGLYTLWNSPRDIHIIIALRCIRLCGFGALSLILVQYLKSHGINETEIGVLLTLTMVGDLIFSFLLALISDSLGRRKTMLLSSFIMCISGISMYYFTNIYLIAFVMIFGIVTPSGGEVGPFRSVEQSAISTLCLYEHRSDIFSWYTFSGGVAAGVGNFTIGNLTKRYGYGVCFVLYSTIGAILFILSYFLSDKIELDNDVTLLKAADVSETSSLVISENEDVIEEIDKDERKSLFHYILPGFSSESLKNLLILTTLLCLDALGLSLSAKSWMVYYFKTTYNLSPNTLGTIFGLGSVIGAFSALIGTFFCKKYGPIKTMISVHTTASILLALHSLPIGLISMSALFLVRAFVRTMDLPSKHVFISTTVQPHERTAAIGFINACKTLVTTVGPVVSGYLASKDSLWLCFLIAGFLRLSYDFGLFFRYWNHSPKI